MRLAPRGAAVALALTGVTLAPTASADSCASTIAEHTVCTPVYAVYCAIYATKTLVKCEANVVTHCLTWCPRDLDEFLVLP